jgi:putative endopeptidase
MHRASIAIALAASSLSGIALAAHGIQTGDLNPGAEACTDFYEFANGQWRAENPIPSYMDRWSRRWASGEDNKANLKNILIEVSARQDWQAGSTEQLIGDHYAACVNESGIDKLGMTPAQPMLARIDSLKNMDAVQAMIGEFAKLGISAPIANWASQDLHDPTMMIVHLGVGGIGLPDRDYYIKAEQRFLEAREKYLAHVAKMLELAGTKPVAARKAAGTVFAFERHLAEASLDNVELRDPKLQDHKTKFADLAKLAPHFDWTRYFEALNLPQGDVNVTQPKFLEEFDQRLSGASLAEWKTYLRWQFLNAEADALTKAVVEENFAFYGKFLTGASELKPRAARCAENTDALLGEALGRRYVTKYFPPEAKARMQEMVRNILLAMKDTIDGLDWMSAETKQSALEKLSTFNSKIGYPDKWKDYAGVKIGRSSYWDNVDSALRWNVADGLAQAGKPVDRGRWDMTPPTTDAYYNPSLNEIVFPAGILQPPGFDLAATDAVNYGSIGVVIGHEISHGFDDRGAQFDAQGRLHNWWSDVDLEKFKERGQCVVDQYEGYFIEPDFHHNGKLVLGESIADLGGVKLAFLAYQKSREGKGSEPTIDGFTPEQQFFLAWGQWRGDAIRQEAQRLMVQGDPHPISKYRVNGPLSNLKGFRDAFDCKTDAAMVRQGADRCEVW